MIVLADWTEPVSAVSGAVAAVAALITIVFAKRSANASREAAQASRDAVREEQAMRIEDDFRRFGDALLSLWQYAGDARQSPGSPQTQAILRYAQIRLLGMLSPRVRIDLPDAATDQLDKALNRSTPPDQVYGAASVVLGHLEQSWDEWRGRLNAGELDPKGPPLTIRKRGFETERNRQP